MNDDPDNLRSTVAALRSIFRLVTMLMRGLELELASLSPGARQERMSEFDERVAALDTRMIDIEVFAKAFLDPNPSSKGHA